MPIEVKKVNNKKEKKAFVKFQLDLYKDNPNFVPPLVLDEINVLDETKNPVFENSEAQFFLAYRGHKIVGRIAAIINWTEVKVQKKSKMRFGWYDTIDDFEVSKVLLQKVEEIAYKKEFKQIEGPVGFSNLDKAGLLIKGFEEIGTMVTLYNHPYYVTHLKRLGYKKHLEWVEYEILFPKSGTPEKIKMFSKVIAEKYQLKARKFKNKTELKALINPMFELLDSTYSKLPSYVPITQKQIDYYREKYIHFINPDYVTVVEDSSKEMVAFAISMPSYSKALKKAGGKLFPFGWYYLWRANRKNDKVAFYLIGVKPEYQNKGITSILFHEMGKTFEHYNIKYMETNPELSDNTNVQALWNEYDRRQNKIRRSYIKNLKY